MHVLIYRSLLKLFKNDTSSFDIKPYASFGILYSELIRRDVGNMELMRLSCDNVTLFLVVKS